MACLFCDIVDGKIPAERVFEDEHCIAFHDINPQAPVHVLMIPKQHIEHLNDAASHPELLGHMMAALVDVAQSLGVAESGYRVVVNCNEEGGQEVYHLHLHLLGGKHLGWPPFA